MDCNTFAEGLITLMDKITNREYEKDNWRSVLDLIASIFNADCAAIGTFDESGTYLIYDRISTSVYQHIEDYDPLLYKVPVWKSISKEVLSKGYVIDNDYQNNPIANERWKQAGLQSILITTLGHKHQIGTLAVGNFSKDKKPFTEEDGKLLKNLATILAFVVEEEEEKEELFKKAIKDELTQLYNRYYLEHEGKKEIERARRYKYPLSLIILDLDNFKQINDRFGHTQGDRVLRKFARIIMSNIRRSDIAVRYGGEEFIILLPYTHIEDAEKIAERIRKTFESTKFRFDHEIASITVSGGVATIEDGEDLFDLIDKADKALYYAKKEGKNKIWAQLWK